MIKEFVDRFMNARPRLEEVFSKKHPECYKDIVKEVINVLSDNDEYGAPDPDRIHEIDDGQYQGTLVYVIGDNSNYPSKYWYVMVDYGSCSGCDTLQRIQQDSEGTPTKEEVRDYMMLALHIVQGLKEM